MKKKLRITKGMLEEMKMDYRLDKRKKFLVGINNEKRPIFPYTFHRYLVYYDMGS